MRSINIIGEYSVSYNKFKFVKFNERKMNMVKYFSYKRKGSNYLK